MDSNLTFLIVLFVLIAWFVSVPVPEKSNGLKVQVIQTLVRGCSRWAVASLQDRSPLIAVLHANYAAGYLWALRDVFSDTDIQRFGGITDMQLFQKRIVDVQDVTTRRVINECPQYASDIDKYLGRLSQQM